MTHPNHPPHEPQDLLPEPQDLLPELQDLRPPPHPHLQPKTEIYKEPVNELGRAMELHVIVTGRMV